MDFSYLAIVIGVGFLLLIFLILWKGRTRTAEDQALSLLQQQLDSLRDQVGKSLTELSTALSRQLQEVTGQVGKRLDKSTEVLANVSRQMGALSQATERVYEVGRNISTLEQILRAPKFRGGLGELLLGELLSQILPKRYYQEQYSFKSGDKVDAVIFIGQGMVPVDSKFPLENFRRIVECSTEGEGKKAKKAFLQDVKRHIDDISAKYILPDEGTYEFALMYIPAENVYYETIIKGEGEGEGVFSYALKQKVFPASPNTFYAYLQTIVLGLKGLKIEKGAKEILEHLARLQGDFSRFRKEFDILGGHIANSKNKYEEAGRKLNQLEDRLATRLSGIETAGALPEETPSLPGIEEEGEEKSLLDQQE
jgi:DNA recombination protein RmuC